MEKKVEKIMKGTNARGTRPNGKESIETKERNQCEMHFI
jgi:hypothetical protein